MNDTNEEEHEPWNNRCVGCGTTFKPHPENARRQVTCGAARCSKRADHIRASQRLEYREANARRCRAWYAANKSKHKANVARRAAGSSAST